MASTDPTGIAVMIKTDLAVKRDAIRGVCAFQRDAGLNWRVELVPQIIRGGRWVLPGGIAGVVAWPDNDAQAEWVGQQALPAVVLGRTEPQARPGVMLDNARIGMQVARYFRERGLRHLAGYSERNRQGYSRERWRGFAEAARAFGVEPAFYSRPGDEAVNEQGEQDSRARLGAWLRALPKPVGILADRDLAGYYLVQTCRLEGLRVPYDVAVVAVGADDLVSEISTPSLSAVILPGRRMGWEAGRLLATLLKGRSKPQDVLIDSFEINERASSDVYGCGDAAVTKALHFIREQAVQGADVTKVVKTASVSRRTLEVRFRHATGRTLQEALMATRLETAKRLLLTTGLSLAEVADRCGYRELARLSEAFVRAEGRPPGAWRREALKISGPFEAGPPPRHANADRQL